MLGLAALLTLAGFVLAGARAEGGGNERRPARTSALRAGAGHAGVRRPLQRLRIDHGVQHPQPRSVVARTRARVSRAGDVCGREVAHRRRSARRGSFGDWRRQDATKTVTAGRISTRRRCSSAGEAGSRDVVIDETGVYTPTPGPLSHLDISYAARRRSSGRSCPPSEIILSAYTTRLCSAQTLLGRRWPHRRGEFF